MRRTTIAALSCLLLFTAPSAFARHHHRHRDAKANPGHFDYYLLALAWAPNYCGDHPTDHSSECRTGGHTAFVLHGLWPESASGPPPQWCSLTQRPAPETVRQGLCATPVPWLIEHEWAKHGSCMAQSPEAYWGIARHIWARFRWPDADRLSMKQGLTVGDLREAVALANPGLPRAAVGVVTGERGWLRELRICHNRQYRPVACPRATFGPADGGLLKIWRGL
jgi:ribonuclease T2